MDQDYWDERYDGYDWDDAPEIERVLDDGTAVPADEPLPPGLYVSRRVVDKDWDEHEGVLTGVSTFIETTRITPQMQRAEPVPRPAVRHATCAARRSVANGGRRRRPRSTAGRASPSRLGDDPEPSQPAVRRADPGTIRRRSLNTLVRGGVR